MSGYFLLKEDGHRWVLGEVHIKIHSKDLEECRIVNKRCWEVPEMKEDLSNGSKVPVWTPEEINSISFYKEKIS